MTLTMTSEEFQAKFGRKRFIRRPAGNVLGARGPLLPFPVVLDLDIPPSVNKLWATVPHEKTGKPIRVLSADARRYARAVALMARGHVEDVQLDIRLELFWKCYTKAGAVKQIDATNRIKFFEDCLAESLGFNDKMVFRFTVEKTDWQGPQFCRVTINRYIKAAK